MMWPFKWKLSACTFTWYYLFVKSLENEIWKFGRNLPLATFGSERLNNSDFCSLSCSIGFKTDGPNQGNWRKRFHLSVSPACQTSLIAEPIQITGNKANECPVQRWKATQEIVREQLPIVNSQSSQTVYPSSTLTSSQSDLLGPQDYRTAVPCIDINHTEFAQDVLIGLGIKFDEWPGITLKSL